MGFWSNVGRIAGKVGNYVLEEAKAAADRSKEYRAEMLSKSDGELMKIVSNEIKRSPLKAGAASKELKDRGYTPEEIKEHVKAG